jgi:hypothetical protein
MDTTSTVFLFLRERAAATKQQSSNKCASSTKQSKR